MTGSESASRGDAGEFRRGWRVLVASATGTGTGAGLFILSASLFLEAMRPDFGGSMTAVTFLPVLATVMAMGAPLTGWLVSSLGSRPVAIGGLAYLAIGLVVMAFIPADSTTLMIAAAVVGLGAPASSVIPYTKAVATWFSSNAGMAFGITLNGVSITSLAVVPLLTWSIHELGWRAGFLVLAAIVAGVGLPVVVVLLREREADKSPQDSVGLTITFFRDWRYWFLLSAIASASVAMGAFMAHLHPILAGGDVSIQAATALGIVFVVSIGLGRLVGGFCLDRWNDGLVALVLLLLAAAGAVLMSQITADLAFPLLIGATFLIGMGQGAEADFLAYFAMRIFGLDAFAKIVGTFAMVSGLGVGAGAFLFAALFDAQGSYRVAALCGAVFYVIGGMLFYIVRKFDGQLRPHVPKSLNMVENDNVSGA